MKCIIPYLTSFLFVLAGQSLARPEWVECKLKTPSLTTETHGINEYQKLEDLRGSLKFSFKNNSRYRAILEIIKPSFYVSGYVEHISPHSPKNWGYAKTYFKDVLITGNTKSVELFPGETITVTYGTWTFQQMSRLEPRNGTVIRTRIVFTECKSKFELKTREVKDVFTDKHKVIKVIPPSPPRR